MKVIPNTTDAVLLRLFAASEDDGSGQPYIDTELHQIVGWMLDDDGAAIPVCPGIGKKSMKKIMTNVEFDNELGAQIQYLRIFSPSLQTLSEYGARGDVGDVNCNTVAEAREMMESDARAKLMEYWAGREIATFRPVTQLEPERQWPKPGERGVVTDDREYREMDN